MAQSVQWKVVLVAPGENEVSLLAELTSRPDAQIIGVVDPNGTAVGTAIAEIMGIRIFTELGEPSLQQADYLVYPPRLPLAEFLARQATALGLTPLASSELLIRLSSHVVTRREGPHPPVEFEALEREMETIHRTLSRIEEALQRESLLRWLLSLATRAVHATSGSIMLFDEKAQELYIAYAYGLSEATQHGTRLRLGEGIAGRVAQLRRSELLCGRQAKQAAIPCDRPHISAAICAPLLWNDALLGVLNVSVSEGDPVLTEDDLATADHLARRISLILQRFLDIQKAQTGEMFQSVDRELHDLMQRTDDIETVLAAWAGTLTLALEAASCSLAVVCDDGSLLVAEGGQDGQTRVWYETAENPAWQEVRQTGGPLVVRQSDPAPQEEGGLTVYYLPVGIEPVQGVLTAVFTTAAEAHRFHSVSGEILYLLEKRLTDLVRRITQQDRMTRLAALTANLTEIATAGPDPGDRARLIQTAARHLTGAEDVYLVEEHPDGSVRFLSEENRDPEAWFSQARRLLQEAREGGWRVTLLSGETDPRPEELCLLAVAAPADSSAQGMILRGKKRRHFLDGATFTEFDAQLVRHLVNLLTVTVATAMATKSPAEPAISPDAPQEDVAQSITPALREVVLDILRREMDRCDRYHTTFALTAFRPQLEKWDLAAARELTGHLLPRVRSSDYITCLEDGTLLAILPEDIQAVSRLQRRLVTLMRELTNIDSLVVATGHTIYPGRFEDARRLLDETLATLM